MYGYKEIGDTTAVEKENGERNNKVTIKNSASRHGGVIAIIS